jgi:integrase/recombinase XerD
MRKLRAETHRRMLGNGYCARPVGLDSHFRVDLRVVHLLPDHHRVPPHLQRQRDDATAKGQLGRTKIFDGLLSRLDDATF